MYETSMNTAKVQNVKVISHKSDIRNKQLISLKCVKDYLHQVWVMTAIRLERTLHDILMMQNTSALTMSHIHETCKQHKSEKWNMYLCSNKKNCLKYLAEHTLINQSIHWHEQNAVIPCRSHEPPPFLPIIHFFLPLLSANHSSILPHFIQPSISWSASWSYCFQIHVQYSFGNSIFFHSLYVSKPT